MNGHLFVDYVQKEQDAGEKLGGNDNGSEVGRLGGQSQKFEEGLLVDGRLEIVKVLEPLLYHRVSNQNTPR